MKVLARKLRDLVTRHGRSLIEIGQFLIFAAIIVTILSIGAGRLRYNWQWHRVPRYLVETTADGIELGLLLQGLLTTLKISAVSLVLAALFGLVTALFRLSRSYTANIIAQIYLEAIRNTPLLIQLFFVYFVVAPIFGMSPFLSAVLALSLFEGAYASEIIRGAILSVPTGQWESAYSLGLSSVDTYRFVILPQALRKIVPPLTSQAVSLVKDSALVSTIAIYDLTMRGSAAVAETFLTFEIWFTVAAIYIILNGILSAVSRFLERSLDSSSGFSIP